MISTTINVMARIVIKIPMAAAKIVLTVLPVCGKTAANGVAIKPLDKLEYID